MGLFKKKSKDVFLTEKEECSSVVIKKKLKNDQFYIGNEITVPANHIFVIGKRGKVLDYFNEGKFVVSIANLPRCCKKLKIDRVKDGGLPKNFQADAYYVSKLSQQDFWKSYQKIKVGDKHNGYLKFSVEGSYTYKVQDVSEYMQSLLNEYNYIKTGEAEKLLEEWVSEKVVSLLQKYNFSKQDVLENQQKIYDKIYPEIQKLFRICGLELVEFTIDKYKYAKLKQTENNNEAKQPSDLQNNNQSVLQKEEDASLINNNKEYVPFGSMQIKNNKNTKKIKNIQNFDINLEQSVDFTNNMVYTKNNQTCSVCGNVYNQKAECPVCGSKKGEE